MERHIDEHTAETQLNQIMDLAVDSHQRFIIERQGEPAVVIMNAQDYMALVAPDWLQAAWQGAKERGIDKMTMEEIDEEIAAYRRKKAATLEHQAR